MNVISNILYWISTGLLVPVIVLLILFFVRAILMIGGFFGQYLTVKRVNAQLASKIKTLTADGVDEFNASLPTKSGSLVVEYLRQIIANRGNDARIELLISEYEIEADKNLSTSKTMTKMGPILGLMGTLIPMGPALVGLSTGDIASMAYNMQVAFATTVVGLVISAIGFVTQQTKERWYVRDLAVLEYVAQLVTAKKTTL
jgi:biopolymer transport protein ExbB/TolQ